MKIRGCLPLDIREIQIGLTKEERDKVNEAVPKHIGKKDENNEYIIPNLYLRKPNYEDTYLFVDDNGTPTKIAYTDLKGSQLHVVDEIPNEAMEGDFFIVKKENESSSKLCQVTGHEENGNLIVANYLLITTSDAISMTNESNETLTEAFNNLANKVSENEDEIVNLQEEFTNGLTHIRDNAIIEPVTGQYQIDSEYIYDRELGDNRENYPPFNNDVVYHSQQDINKDFYKTLEKKVLVNNQIVISDTKSDFPSVGETNKIYIASDTKSIYIWQNNEYVTVSIDLSSIRAQAGDNINEVGNPNVTYSNGTFIFNYLKGERGPKGDKGDNGIDGTNGKDGVNGVSCTHQWEGTTLTVTSASGTSSANLKGEAGTPGVNGNDGITPHIGANNNWYIGNTDTGIAASSTPLCYISSERISDTSSGYGVQLTIPISRFNKTPKVNETFFAFQSNYNYYFRVFKVISVDSTNCVAEMIDLTPSLKAVAPLCCYDYSSITSNVLNFTATFANTSFNRVPELGDTFYGIHDSYLCVLRVDAINETANTCDAKIILRENIKGDAGATYSLNGDTLTITFTQDN
nr:MAG TPA: nucleoid-associated protein [Caudoviricetes sp.]